MAWLLLALSVSMATVSAQIPCPNNMVCSCTDTNIECHDRALVAVPVFTSDSHYTTLHLENNMIETLPDDAFKNLQKVMIIFLRNNTINTVSRNAFRGVEAGILHLDLAQNNLTEFPLAAGALENLMRIDVSNNPIDENHFDEHTMYDIGDKLTRLDFGSDSLHQWPNTLRHLQALEVLNVTGGSFYTLPPTAFHGFEGTLKTLSIQHTQLIALPFALSKLRFLDHLYFDHNHAIGDSGILITSLSNDTLTNLQYVSLVDDNLTYFPSLLRFLRNVHTLILDSNRLAFVSDSSVAVAVGTAITTLSLRNCSLSRVPGALSKLTNLTKLDLTDNQIRSFENSDFQNMGRLTTLTVTRNPLEFIANETFKDLRCLQQLDIMESNIKTMPEAIRFLRNLTTLTLPLDKIECTCNIVWLKQFMEVCNTNLKIAGSCETIDSPVADYLRAHIPNCPNYASQTQCVSSTCT
ncbi:keratocan-like [Dreissena polymorpha]|uniref:Uncharacterized protein n=1 Tax=Dreissena polymorpha TaxID=45954 RepID=A0A9D4JI85_DREPO|nr:keratocan-like [Dreissena polymorpha]KAH3809688.1 hypothetical protein DPMN_138064 [Dreissena polymorpha]